jgi:hypothetical protein
MPRYFANEKGKAAQITDADIKNFSEEIKAFFSNLLRLSKKK